MKEKKIKSKTSLLSHDPTAEGNLGGVQRFASAHKISVGKAKRFLERELRYTMHKPRRRHFPTLPVVVDGMDHQWVADLVEVERLSKSNRVYRYLLTVIDVLSKYAWVQQLKAKTGIQLVKAFEKILKEGRQPIQLQTYRGTEFYNQTFQQFLKKQGIHHFFHARRCQSLRNRTV